MAPIRNALHIFGPQYAEVSKEAVGVVPSALDTQKMRLANLLNS